MKIAASMNHTITNVSYTGKWYPHLDIPALAILVMIAVLGLANIGVIATFVVSRSLRTPFNFIVLGKELNAP